MSARPRLQAQHTGVYASDAPRRHEGAALRAGWAVLGVELSACADKDALLLACRDGLALPAHFGANWDALADCLGDLSWRPAPGYLVIFQGASPLARTAPQTLATLIDVLRSAAAEWGARGTGFVALIEGAPALGLEPFVAP